jgi:hypothetical protein
MARLYEPSPLSTARRSTQYNRKLIKPAMSGDMNQLAMMTTTPACGGKARRHTLHNCQQTFTAELEQQEAYKACHEAGTEPTADDHNSTCKSTTHDSRLKRLPSALCVQQEAHEACQKARIEPAGDDDDNTCVWRKVLHIMLKTAHCTLLLCMRRFPATLRAPSYCQLVTATSVTVQDENNTLDQARCSSSRSSKRRPRSMRSLCSVGLSQMASGMLTSAVKIYTANWDHSR